LSITTLLGEPESSAQLAVEQIVNNAETQVIPILILRALAHTVANGGIPLRSKELAARIRFELPQLESLGKVVSMVAIELRHEREVAIAIRNLYRSLGPLPPSHPRQQEIGLYIGERQWSTAIQKFLENGDIGVFEPCSTGAPMLESALLLPRDVKLNRCAGRLSFSSRGGSTRTHLAEYSDKVANGCYPQIANGVCSAIQIQLSHGTVVMERTLFSNPEFCDALAAAAAHIRRRQHARDKAVL
jgi:hypothetical protein